MAKTQIKGWGPALTLKTITKSRVANEKKSEIELCSSAFSISSAKSVSDSGGLSYGQKFD